MGERYIWQRAEWPHFSWDALALQPILSALRYNHGRLAGMMHALGMEAHDVSALETMTLDVVKSCEIEGVVLDSARVRSSVARHIGADAGDLPEPDRYTDGLVEIMLDATRNAGAALDEERLFGWHAALFPSGRSGLYRITVGGWRTGDDPMQVVSGAMGREQVHYEAPPSRFVPGMMREFLEWIEVSGEEDFAVKAALAHLWFVAIHPFDDGNGRLARTITDMLMSRSDGFSHRRYSVSAVICKRRKEYYAVLERATCGGLDVTEWLEWFLETVDAAMRESIVSAERTICKHRFWSRYSDVQLNGRQTRMVNMMWDGFKGRLTNRKWAKITKTSASTALRDIQGLVACGMLKPAAGGGRSAHYVLTEAGMGDGGGVGGSER